MDFDLTIIPTGRIEQAILEIRGLRVMVDADLAATLWGDDKGAKSSGQT